MNAITLYQEMKFICKDAFYIILQKLGVIARSVGLTWILAHLGKQALAAGALVLSGFSICTYLVMGTLASITICAAHAKGAGKIEEIAKYVRHGFILAVLLSIPLILIFLFMGSFLSFLGQSPNVIPVAAQYAHLLAWAILPFAIFVVLQEFLLSISKFKLIMFSSLIGIVIILALGYVLALGKFGLPTLGVQGLGFAAIFSFVSVSIYLALLIALGKDFRHFHIFKNFWKYDKKSLQELWHVGWPLGAKWAVEIGIFLVIAILIGRNNVNELAAQQILLQFVLFSALFVAGIDQVTMIRTSEALGNKKIASVKLISQAGMLLGLIFAVVVSLLLFLFATEIIKFFTYRDAPTLASVGAIVLALIPVIILFQIFDSLRTISTGILAAFKDTRFPFLIEILSFWVIGLLIGYFLSRDFSTILSYWIGLTIACISCAITLIFRIILQIRKTKLLHKR